ncbi:MAG TPA: hypothetical protein VN408_09730 [Actinoplanes sp.]|nr:hypothetical protein [Actinoplanes sp.]
MLVHPSTLMDLAHDRQRNLTAEADRWRLLSLARLARRCRAAARVGRGQPTGSLASCERSAVVPAL